MIRYPGPDPVPRNDPQPASVVLPQELRDTVAEWHGDEGRAWLATLPDVVAGLAERWHLRLGEHYAGGTASLVLAVEHAGSPVPSPSGWGGEGSQRAAVLKVPLLDDENRAEADALRHYAGEGAVRLYDADPTTGALLLERLHPGTSLATFPDRSAAIGIACQLLRRLWKPPPADHQFTLVHDLAAQWGEAIPARHVQRGRPFPQRLIDQAASLAERFAHPEPAELQVVVNRDAHLGNILAAQRGPWLLIDPKPLVGPPVFDAGFLLLDLLGRHPTAGQAQRVVHVLADGLGVDVDGVRGWALLRAVENTLWCLDVGIDPAADLARASALAGESD